MTPLMEHWGLREQPFESVADARFFFPSSSHAEALARLEYLVDQRTLQIGMLTGEVGCGKSMVRQVLSSRVDAGAHCVVQFENSSFGFADHLRRLLGNFGLEDRAVSARGDYELYELVAECLRQLHETHSRSLVLLFDEAQDLPPDVLRQVKALTNLNERGRGSLTVLLIGQPELRELVARVPAVDQRVALRYHLRPMAAADVGRYLGHRLAAAGCPREDAFDAGATERLYQASRGIPREINRLARLALEVARAKGVHRVDGETVFTVVEDLRRHQPMPPWA
jgi:general secretion pathway protein A